MSDEIRAALSGSPLFGALTDRQADQIAGMATVRTFDTGDVLVEQGTTGAMALWILLDGNVDVRVDGTTVATLGPGDHVGEIAVLAGQDMPRTASVVAAGPTRAIRLASWDVHGFIKSNPDVAMTIIRELARRLDAMNRAASGR